MLILKPLLVFFRYLRVCFLRPELFHTMSAVQRKFKQFMDNPFYEEMDVHAGTWLDKNAPTSADFDAERSLAPAKDT